MKNHRPLAQRLLLLVVFLAFSRSPALLEAADPAAKPAAPGIEQVAPPKDIAELRGIEDRVKQLVAKVVPATVAVQVGASQGSGVIVSRDGLVMTAGHVVGKPGQPVVFYFADGKKAKGTTLGLYHCVDAGMMKITDKGDWPFVDKGQSAGLKLGSWCVAVGHPLGYQAGRPPVVRIGRLLRIEANVLQTDCPIVAGDSGGPVFDLGGKVVAINSRIGGTTELNLHVPVDLFTEHWDRLVKGEIWHTNLPSRDCDPIKAIFRPVVSQAARCTVRVKCDGRDASMGTIVGPNGWVLTKASELKGKIVCRLPDKRELDARIVGVNSNFDLAMLKLETAGLPPVSWFSQDPGVGQWVVTPGSDDASLALGIVSVPRRAIPHASGAMGVLLADVDGGVRIESVIAQSPAERAGLKPKDVVTHVDGQPVKNRQETIAIVKRHRLGETVKLTINRDKQPKEFSIKLAKVETQSTRRRDMQNEMGVGISRRSDGFPNVLQHDTVLKPVDCGGPLVDLNGRVIGINIAHAGRTETYCLPTDVLMPLMYDLMSGRLAPPDVKPAEQKPAEPKPVDAKADGQKNVGQKDAGQKPGEQKPGEQKPSGQKPGEQKPGEQKPQAKPAAEKHAEPKKSP